MNITYDPIDTNENDDTADGDVEFTAVNTDYGTVGGDDMLGGPSSSSDAGLSLGGGYTTIDPNNPTIVVVEGQANTDGSTNGQIQINVDESGGTTADYTVNVRADKATGSNYYGKETITFYLPPGGTVEVANTVDPNNGNQLLTDRKVVL